VRKAIKEKLKKWLDAVLMLHDTPHSIALGVAVGIFISLTPTVGFHIWIVILLSLFIRFNRTAGCISVWLNSPLTLPPTFFFNYVVGSWLLRIPTMGWGEFYKVFHDAYVYDHWYQNLFAMAWALGKLTIEVAGPLWLGSIVVGVVACVPIYLVVRRLATKVQEIRRAHHRAQDAGKANPLTDEASDGKAL
jgi:hypothetical protein